MKIRTKLVISNILIIIIPIGIMCGLLGMFINGPGAESWETMETLYDDANGTYSAQSLIHLYKMTGNLEDIKQPMANAGYHFSVYKDGRQKFSSLTQNDLKYEDKAARKLDRNLNYIVNKGSVVVVHEVFKIKGCTYEISAVRTDSLKNGENGVSYIKKYIFMYIAFLLIILIVSIVLLNILLSWWIARSILKPLSKLSAGSSLIRSGNFDFEMKDKRRDEFGNVINDFDDMRLYLKESSEGRRRYEQYRKDLVTGISHDLRTPLTSIKGYMEGLRDGIAGTEEMKAKYYEAIEVSVHNIENLINDLTDFSKLETGRFDFNPEITELNEFYKDSIETFNRKHFADSIVINMEECTDRIFVNINRQEFERVNANIFENSLKYREKDHSEVTVSLMKTENFAYIRIADDGPGIRENDVKQIFECFYRGDASRTLPGEGSGIGLAVVKQIVEGSGGKVNAENDRGLVITIKLPLLRGVENEENPDC